jgi:hypothetical protein
VNEPIASSAAEPTNDDEMLAVGPQPTRGVLLLAFVAIVFGGIAGAVIGAGLVGIGCRGSCSTATGVAAVIGGLAGAGGVGIVAVLVLRAMSEWRRIGRG